VSKFATVLFADVARSTAIAEQLDPEDWAAVMNGAFAFMNASVARYGGTVSRLMGDAVLALFGAPVAHEDDAERAVRAGLDIQAAAIDYAMGVRQRHGFEFELRVGINTGTAVLAFVGDQVRTEYTAMGDAANVAARLQSAARPGTVLIGADTYKLVHALFDVTPLGPLEVKGKQVAVEAYEVSGAKAVAGNMRGLAGLTSPLVGRDREIEI
jgi:class 3 adenylate cyclase